jgi:hypothetical protein
MPGWIDLFRSLGESLLEVWRAELAALQDDLQRSGRRLGTALGLLGGALVLLFWTVGLLLFALIALLHLWLPWWAAALVVLLLFLLSTGLLAWLGVRGMRRVENPVNTVRRRVDSHLDWWQHGLLAEPKALDVEPADRGEPLGRDLP